MISEEDFYKIFIKELKAEAKETVEKFLEKVITMTELGEVRYLHRTTVSRHLEDACTLFLGQENSKNISKFVELFYYYRKKTGFKVGADVLAKYGVVVQKVLYLPPKQLQDCYNKIVKPGALIRIKGPQKMGKNLLLNKIINRAHEEGYNSAIVNFAETDAEVLSHYQKLLRWFCAYLGDELDLEDKVDEKFKDVFGNNKNCTNYLERYLLAGRSQPLILVLEGVDAVFEVADFNNDFCKMLREWNNAAKLPSRRAKIWKLVRLIISHSTEVYGELDINFSPLAGVGLTVALSGFNLEQVKQLARSYGLGLNDGEVRQLMDVFGGHPYLVQNSLVALKNEEFNLTELLAVAPTEASPFGNHLRELLGGLQRQPKLAAAYREVLGQNRPIQLATNFTFKLESMGLVKIEKDLCRPYCELYRQYFSSRLSNGIINPKL